MSVAIVGVAGAAVAAGGAAYSSYSKSKSQKANAELAAKGAGTVPKAARYKPVDFDQTQLAQIYANINAAPAANALSQITNHAITTDSLNRISQLVPGYRQAMTQYGQNANALLQGKLPFSDVLGVLGDSSARTASVGIPGTGGPASLRDLGLSQLQGMQTGGGLLKDMVNIAEQVDPVSRQMTPQQSYVSPVQRIQDEMSQNQLIQQSYQSAYNLAAQGDPAARAMAALGPQTSTGEIVGGALQTLGSGVSSFSALGAGGGGGKGGTSAGGYGGYAPRQVPYYNGNAGAALQYYTGGR